MTRYGSTRLANGMNHQPTAHPGEYESPLTPRARRLSWARCCHRSQAMPAAAVASTVTVTTPAVSFRSRMPAATFVEVNGPRLRATASRLDRWIAEATRVPIEAAA